MNLGSSSSYHQAQSEVMLIMWNKVAGKKKNLDKKWQHLMFGLYLDAYRLMKVCCQIKNLGIYSSVNDPVLMLRYCEVTTNVEL